jgi:hypothetical protein
MSSMTSTLGSMIISTNLILSLQFSITKLKSTKRMGCSIPIFKPSSHWTSIKSLA